MAITLIDDIVPGAADAWCYGLCTSPVGTLTLAGTRDAAGSRVCLRKLSFPDGSRAWAPAPHWRRDDTAFEAVSAQLGEYFAGERKVFDLEVSPQATPFQRKVLELLATIEFGARTSYGEIARSLGTPGASRAVGAANGANPLPILLPCHRVVGADGSLTGFGGGLDAKRFLLEHEARQRDLFG